ncbi:hypothetical protein [Aquiflexum gelatinilyticum]|uniref:hypothetical protein n=1 Tax=Aquiflexum gelatinilyticum TaxID=2961943 RepID=UPI0021679099|nr:hypothetical protein [Aquiflexum gelatinilyticum]MCS4435216.1 hypothetical protein [Aquiflexum gelatinilyticum]
MTQIVQNSDLSNKLPAEVNIETFKSVYYWLNAKPDSHIKVFPKARLVSFNDILNLNEKIQQKLQNHHLFTNITSLTIGFEKGEIKTFNAWEVFKSHHWEIPDKTESVSINWDITIKLPNYELPQKHTLKVRLGSSLRPNEFFHMMTNGDDETELKENLSFVVCKVDFINVVISKELIQIVEQWYNALPQLYSKSTYQNFLEKHRSIIARSGHYITTFIGLAILYIIFKIHLKNFEISNFNKDIYLDAVFWVICLFGTYFICNIIGASFGQLIYEKVDNIEGPHPFAITKGDKNEQTEIERKNGKITNNLTWQFLIRLTVALISLIISKFVLYK